MIQGPSPNPAESLMRYKQASERKLRLFACECCRLIWHTVETDLCRQAVLIAESYAEGSETTASLIAAYDKADEASVSVGDKAAVSTAETQFRVNEAIEVSTCCIDALGFPARGSPAYGEQMKAAWLQRAGPQVELIRCIFGSPYRPVVADPRWLTFTVRDLAAAIYAERAFDRLPILADALEETGCDDTSVLTHCRGPGPHVRGCWVVDLVLGKT